jgi:putative ABC transport system ATP-binding protein
MNPQAPQIELFNVAKAYAGYRVLNNISLTIHRGDFVVIVGRSGSGKSTLLNLIGALDRPTEGEIRLFDQRVDGLTEQALARLRRHGIGFVFQFFNLIPTLTASENIRLPLALNGVPPGEADHRLAELLEELGLTHCAARFPDELSGGEQQRAAIARAVAHRPELVLADEPTGNLDLETAQAVIELLDQTCRRRGTTLVMATHAREVIGLADRVLTIRNRQVEETRL